MTVARFAIVLAILPFAGFNAASAQQPLEVRQMVCQGNEPFWSATVAVNGSGATARLDSLAGDATRKAAYEGTLSRLGFLDPPWTVFRGTDVANGADPLVIVARAEPCLDTMSDEPPFDDRAVVSFSDGAVVTGCCSTVLALNTNVAPVADFASKPEFDWSRGFPVLKAALGRCLEDNRGHATAVTFARPLDTAPAGDPDGSRAVVTLRTESGEALNCIAGTDGQQIDWLEPAADTSGVSLGHGQPAFFPHAGGAEPLFACGRIERVEADDGTLVGFLHYGGPCSAVSLPRAPNGPEPPRPRAPR